MSADEYQVLDSTSIYRGHVISVRTDQLRMSDGAVKTREIVEHDGAVVIVALDDDDQVVMVRQYRHPVAAFLDELPAGLLDVDGESALVAAQRELFEEAALRAERWHVLVDLYSSPGFSTEAIRIYLARGLSDVEPAQRYTASDEELLLTVSRVPLDDAVTRALSGSITNAAAVAGILAAAAARARGWNDLRPAGAPWPARPGR
jgi:8-oxo-dGTP pyrophosphatase MutT (NUDIX family)